MAGSRIFFYISSCMKRMLLFLAGVLPVTEITAQTADSTRQLHEVVVEAYLNKQNLLQVPTSASILSAKQLRLQPGITLVPAMNTVPGVRMEERSPVATALSVEVACSALLSASAT